jgi:hypothetical protein
LKIAEKQVEQQSQTLNITAWHSTAYEQPAFYE